MFKGELCCLQGCFRKQTGREGILQDVLWESDLWDTVDWGKQWLVDFSAGKTQLALFDWSNKNGSVDVKIDGSVLEEK